MVIVSRNSDKKHYFDTKSLICEQIFKENLTITIAMNIERIQTNIHLNSQKPINRFVETLFCVSTFYSHYNRLYVKRQDGFKLSCLYNAKD